LKKKLGGVVGPQVDTKKVGKAQVLRRKGRELKKGNADGLKKRKSRVHLEGREVVDERRA